MCQKHFWNSDQDGFFMRFSLFTYEYVEPSNWFGGGGVEVHLLRADGQEYVQFSGVGVPVEALTLPKSSSNYREGEVFWLVGDTDDCQIFKATIARKESTSSSSTSLSQQYSLNFTHTFDLNIIDSTAKNPSSFITDAQGSYFYVTCIGSTSIRKLLLHQDSVTSQGLFTVVSSQSLSAVDGKVLGNFGLAMSSGIIDEATQSNALFISSMQLVEEGKAYCLRFNVSSESSSSSVSEFSRYPTTGGNWLDRGVFSLTSQSGAASIIFDEGTGNFMVAPRNNIDHMLYWINGETMEQISVALHSSTNYFLQMESAIVNPETRKVYIAGKRSVGSQTSTCISEWKLPERILPTTSTSTTTTTSSTTSTTTNTETSTSTTTSSTTTTITSEQPPPLSSSSTTTANENNTETNDPSSTIQEQLSSSTTTTPFSSSSSTTTTEISNNNNETNNNTTTTEDPIIVDNNTSIPPPTTRIPTPIEEANTAVGSTTGLIAGLSANPAAATTAFKALSMTLLANCGNLTLRENPLGVDSNPFGFDFSSSSSEIDEESGLGTYLGAVIGNLIPIFGLTFLLLIAGILVKFVCVGDGGDDDSDNDENENENDSSSSSTTSTKTKRKHKKQPSVDETLQKLRAPGIFSPIWILFGPPSAKAIATILASDYKTTREIGFAAPAIIFYLLIPLISGIYIFVKVRKHEVLIEYEDEEDDDEDQHDDEKLLSSKKNYQQNNKNPNQQQMNHGFCAPLAKYLFMPKAEWEDSSFVQKYGLAFDCYRNGWFFLFDYIVAVAVGLVTGGSLICSSDSCCNASSIAVLVFVLIHFVALVIVRPLLTRFDIVINILLSGCVCVAAGLAVASNYGAEIMELLNGFTMAELVLCLIDSVVTVLPLLYEAYIWVKEKCSNQKTKIKKRSGGRGWAAAFSSNNLNRRRKIQQQSNKNHNNNNLREIISTFGSDDEQQQQLLMMSNNDDDEMEELDHHEEKKRGSRTKEKSSSSSSSKENDKKQSREKKSSSSSSSSSKNRKESSSSRSLEKKKSSYHDSKNNKRLSSTTTIDEANELLGIASSSRAISKEKDDKMKSKKREQEPQQQQQSRGSDRKSSASSSKPLFSPRESRSKKNDFVDDVSRKDDHDERRPRHQQQHSSSSTNTGGRRNDDERKDKQRYHPSSSSTTHHHKDDSRRRSSTHRQSEEDSERRSRHHRPQSTSENNDKNRNSSRHSGRRH